MKRVLTTLAILLVVVIAGMTALVLLVNPNDFRDYMTRQVEQRSGYQLTLEGQLRWHVWPQLSILSGPVVLKAPGATQPVLRAENMRLDVNLLPLLSHQLAVKQVMLKGAVVRLTPDSERQRPADAPVGPPGSDDNSTVATFTHGWRFDIDRLRIADSLLVWQQDNGEQLNLRDFNLSLDQQQSRQGHIELRSRIVRDQRELQVTLNSDVNFADYPHNLSAVINQLDFQLTGADLPRQGIKGQAALNAQWRPQRQQLEVSDLRLSANESQINGKISATLSDRPQVAAELSSPQLNLDALLGLANGANSDGQDSALQRSGRGPVIADSAARPAADSPLNQLDGQLVLSADRLRWRGMDFDKVALNADVSQGVATLKQFSGNAGQGSFSLPGTVDMRGEVAQASFSPDVKQMAIAPLMKGFNLPDTLSGALSLSGDFRGAGLTVDALMRQWQGDGELTLDNAQIAGLDFRQLVQRAVESSNTKVRAENSGDTPPDFQQIRGRAALNHGAVNFITINAHSPALDYTGSGDVDLRNKTLDLSFGVVVTQGWSGDQALVQQLTQTPVPLRIYGPWNKINYSLKVDQILRQNLRDAAKERLKEWMGRNPDSDKRDEVKKLMKDL